MSHKLFKTIEDSFHLWNIRHSKQLLEGQKSKKEISKIRKEISSRCKYQKRPNQA
jgi:hypothetical protein